MISLSYNWKYGYSLMIFCMLMIDLVVAIDCQLWHVLSKDKESCECCSSVNGLIFCEKGYVYIVRSHCLTWNNATHDVEISRCLYIHQEANWYNEYDMYRISIEIKGLELNNLTCRPYNRQGAQYQHCIDGYGPAAFSDGVTCADCSRYKYLWLPNLFFQLMMVTLLYMVVILFQIKGTSSPLNVIITNGQLGINAIMVGSGFHARIIRFTNKWVAKTALTLIGVLNLDFFRFVIPPLCISPSLRSTSVLAFDYIIAVYPIIVTTVIYVGIELYDRNCRIIVCLSIPFRRLFWCRNWRPKETILSTCSTFLLLSYSKFLFVSISLLFNVRTYNCDGEVIPNSSVLLYDPSVRFLHSDHIPYIILALFCIFVFVLLPPLLLLLYPTRLFGKCLNYCGFKRWDILHLVMDVFQGWYKDGTDGTYDYRPLSALYMILRITFSFAYFKLLMSREYHLFQVTVGLLYVSLGITFLALKPYKRNWMNHIDGTIFFLLAFFSLTYDLSTKITSFIGIFSGLSVAFVVSLYTGYKCLRNLLS